MRKVLAEEEANLYSFDQDSWVNGVGYDQLDLEQHLLLFQLLRNSMLPILTNLTIQQSERVGVYPDRARFTFKELLEYRIQHVRVHLAQIERVREEYRQR
nr:DinB family protein [Brevibacillus sp. RS1.1]